MWIPGASAEKDVVYLGMVQSWRRKKEAIWGMVQNL
jgi:hypothetical protein